MSGGTAALAVTQNIGFLFENIGRSIHFRHEINNVGIRIERQEML